MPELPEVETTQRGIAPYMLDQRVSDVIVRNPNLRYKIPHRLTVDLPGQAIKSINRRGKYLLLNSSVGTVIIHLGMSGSLRIVNCDTPYEKHDHLEIRFVTGRCLRLKDPRRFGLALWTRKDPQLHKLLRDLGPEPLTEEFTGDYLYERSRGHKLAVKQFIMDSHVVAGIGNIYANEALFLSGISPRRAANRISKSRYQHLVKMIRQVLNEAIAQGGTTLRDFTHGDGRPGYFKQHLNVYDREGQPCILCRSPIKHTCVGQRATYYCSHCQH